MYKSKYLNVIIAYAWTMLKEWRFQLSESKINEADNDTKKNKQGGES